MRAVKDSLPTPSIENKEPEGPQWTRARWEPARFSLPFEETEKESGAGKYPRCSCAPKTGTGWSLRIFCARATRGRRLPSLDARTMR